VTEVRNWLPRTAFSEQTVKACLGNLVSNWSSAWFAHAPAAISAVRVGDAENSVKPQIEIVRGNHAEIRMTAPGKRRLLEALFDVDLSTLTLQEGDRRLLDLGAERVLKDLAARFDDAFSKEVSGDRTASLTITISTGIHDVLQIALPEHLIVPMIKARLSRTALGPAPLLRRSDALRRTSVRAKGVVGSAELPIAELDGIGIGDVLVLNKALGEPVELRLADGDVPVAAGMLRKTAGQVSIQL